MKKHFLFALMILFLFFPYGARATEMSTSIPSNSQYTPIRNYGFQINCDDIPNIFDVILEWNGLNNYTSSNISGNFYYNLTNLAGGAYSYRWIVNNTSDVLTFTNTYSILKNSSANITLTLNGTEGDKNYKRYTKANFIAMLNVPNKIISLDSSYPNWVTRTNNSLINNITNLTETGYFTITASWNGDENYLPSSVTYHFDSGPPRLSNIETIPNSHFGYIPNSEYKFQVNCEDTTLTEVWFESNYSGTMTNYYINSDPPVQNSSGLFWIIFKDFGVKDFYYKWHAKDSLEESSTNLTEYEISKMQPLVMQILPSGNIKEGTYITATCYSINPLQLNISDFKFYKNSELIKNITPTTRMDSFLLNVGSHNFTCNANSTENYTNQTITRIINVSSSFQPNQSLGEFKINSINFPSIKIGETGVASFNLVNEMSKNIFNITVNITGIPSSWFAISKPSYIYNGKTKEVKINLTIPSDAEAKTYNIHINVKGNTSDNKAILVIEDTTMSVTKTSQAQNQPPTYITGYNNRTIEEGMFLLEWEDDNGLSGYIFSSNITGEWINDSWIQLNGNSGLINVTKVINSSSSSIAWKIYANDTGSEWSMSDEYIFEASIKTTKTDYSMILIIIISAAVIIIVFTVILILKKGKKVEYVYSKEDAHERSA